MAAEQADASERSGYQFVEEQYPKFGTSSDCLWCEPLIPVAADPPQSAAFLMCPPQDNTVVVAFAADDLAVEYNSE